MHASLPRLAAAVVAAAAAAATLAVAACSGPTSAARGDDGPAPAAAAPAPAEAPAYVHHDVTASVWPEFHRIDATDRITVPAALRRVPVRFRIHGGLAVTSADPAWDVRAVTTGTGHDAEEAGLAVPVRTWEARPVRGAGGDAWPGDAPLTLTYTGVIDHPIVSGSQEYARSFAQTPGTISPEGVVISGSTWWLPVLDEPESATAEGAIGGLVTFTLTADVPADWDVVSQGVRTRHEVVPAATAAGTGGPRRVVTWDCVHPMDEAYLIAARFTVYERAAGSVATQAFLRTPDPNLAAKYLEATAQYLEMYRKLVGPYPFGKFALVENFWETGYGMPSFTLLGPQVIRFPFILHSSYPHEILHNWWGNSVYVDWSRGNWCEGLTAYLADHLIREGQGRGNEYRQDTLKGWRDYASEGRDFALVDFRSRHDSATQAVGYGKCLMLWHMLRVRLGDETFVKGLQTFYARNRFKVAAWDDVAAAFSDVAGEDLRAFVAEWTTRKGALALSAESAGTEKSFTIGLRQTQPGAPFTGVVVPVAVTFAGRPDARVVRVRLDGPESTVTLPADAGDVVRIDVDPEFDVFRTLDLSETPPTLSEMFGAEHVTLIVPGENEALAAQWREFAKTWAAGGKDVQVVAEDAVDVIPAGRAVWALGSANAYGPPVLASLTSCGADVTGAEARFGVEAVPIAGHSFVYVARHPSDPKLAVGWIGSDVAAALPGLARKLPHYGKYSYLAFAGEAPDNVVKGTWPATDSPLVAFVGEGTKTRPPRGKLPPREALAKLAPVFDPERILATATFLADDTQEGRGVGAAGLDRCGDLVAKAFADAGLRPGGGSDGDRGYFDTWTEENGPGAKPATLRNVIGVLPGTNPAMKDQCVVLGAHYDHLGLGWPDVHTGDEGKVHNGADDNASGVAVLCEVARILGAELKPQRTLVFVAFSGEEWGLRGSKRFVSAWKGPKPFAMINLDTVGRLAGRKLMVLGAGTATEWRPIAMGIGFTTGVESTCVADDPGGSDQVSFQAAGVPAIQLFTGPHEDYHRPTDDVAKLDADGMVKVATWLREAAVYLSERPEPLTSTLAGAAPAAPHGGGPGGPAGAGRRVSLGTMPDFEFKGPGVLVAQVLDGSAAKAAGIEKGDVIVAFDGAEVADLRAYSAALKAHVPGDVVKIRFRRGEEVKEVEATLTAR